MSWTTIWSHAQRGIATASSSAGTIQVNLRSFTGVEKIRLVFANQYGCQVQTIQKVWIKVGDYKQPLADFTLSPGELLRTEPIVVDPGVRKWQLGYQAEPLESGFAYHDADFLAGDRKSTFCSGLLAVEAETTGNCVVALGDSLTEGATWTAPLQSKLRKAGIYVVNQGINGSCLLKSGSDRPTSESQNFFYGYDGLRRLTDCFASHKQVSQVILFLGINDLINGELTLEKFQMTIKRLVALCEDQQASYQLCTLTPCLGYPGMDLAKEALRQKINQWLLESYSNVWDFSTIVEGPVGYLAPQFDSGDHLHLNAIAGLAIARQISSDFIKGE
ncbi:GDSL-type esterase/lipase family protein [Enterococcus pseudoavium]|uniref:GDSL-type esterase/lipase family protein n=1 Tax=Enterococcus pseudoavium TaxID=44007 RepID=A0AAE4L1P0_9ENTE|nr:GDSL-type esterase/lipase family protein [Enterococcus pseudoavium]MDT2736996.1 GDSL-type esterase/lipase family protein [Enterococcus pseudoavium]